MTTSNPALQAMTTFARVTLSKRFDRLHVTKKGATRAVVGIVIFALLCVAGLEAIRYWTVGRFMESTDDAYLQADSTIVAPKVSGYISTLLVDDNQAVRAGQILARIDDRDLQTALDDATASIATAAASVANLDAQILAQGSAIREADASESAAAASLSLSQRNDTRRREMAKVGYGSLEQADDASTDTREKSATLDRLKASSIAARQQVVVLTTQRQMALAQLARARATQHQAELNLSYANIVAPIDGIVGARTVRVGQYVQAGTQLMALVPLRRVYVIANFKETQLTNIRPGQPTTIRVDTFSRITIRGRVETIAPASGLEFSLLPPDNATGNFTKIVQRVPVKITFPIDPALAGQLRPGMSVNVSVEARQTVTAAHKTQQQ